MKLQPCPRCGREAVMHDIGIDDVIWQGQCEQCSYRAWAAIDEDKAAAIWNRLAEVYKEMAKKQSYE